MPLTDIQLAYLIDRTPAESRADMRVDDFFRSLVSAGFLIDLPILKIGIAQSIHSQLGRVAGLSLKFSLILEGALLGLKAAFGSFVFLSGIVGIAETAVPGATGFVFVRWHTITGLS